MYTTAQVFIFAYSIFVECVSNHGSRRTFGSLSCYGCRGADLCWALGGIICNFTLILPYFQHWGDKPRTRFFSGEQIKRRPKEKKRSSPKMEDFFPEFKWRPALRCTPESNYWRGCRCRPYSNYWGDTVKLLGGYPPIPHPLRVSAPLYGCVAE